MWKQCDGDSADDSGGIPRNEVEAGNEGGDYEAEEPGLWT